jgi:hypothetical protein
MRAVLELPQISAMAGGYQGKLRKQPADQGRDDPQMVTVDDIWLKSVHSRLEIAGKSGLVGVYIRWGKVAEAGAGIGHDIAHASNGKCDVGTVEPNEPAMGPVDTIQPVGPAGLNTGNQKIGVSMLRRLPQHGLNVDAATGGIGSLTEHMQNFQWGVWVHG